MSDLHVDINERYPLELKDKDVFTVICGDMGGETEMGIDWIRKNVRRGIIVNGNHMPYRNTYERPVKDYKTMTEFREWLRSEFPIGGDISYLDAEIGDFKKEVDGILFMGSCFYSNFRIKEPTWNPSGDKRLNMKCSEYNMNDYRFGYTGRSFPAGADNEPLRITRLLRTTFRTTTMSSRRPPSIRSGNSTGHLTQATRRHGLSDISR